MQFVDEFQLVLDEPRDFCGNAPRIAPAGTFPGQAGKILERRHARRAKFFGIFVAEFFERERTAFSHFDGASDRLGTFGKEPIHLGPRAQEALGVRKAAKPQLGDGAAVPRRGEHVLQHLPRPVVIMHVVGRDEWHAGGLRCMDQPSDVTAILGSAAEFGQEITAIAEQIAIAGQPGARDCRRGTRRTRAAPRHVRRRR